MKYKITLTVLLFGSFSLYSMDNETQRPTTQINVLENPKDIKNRSDELKNITEQLPDRLKEMKSISRKMDEEQKNRQKYCYWCCLTCCFSHMCDE